MRSWHGSGHAFQRVDRRGLECFTAQKCPQFPPWKPQKLLSSVFSLDACPGDSPDSHDKAENKWLKPVLVYAVNVLKSAYFQNGYCNLLEKMYVYIYMEVKTHTNVRTNIYCTFQYNVQRYRNKHYHHNMYLYDLRSLLCLTEKNTPNRREDKRQKNCWPQLHWTFILE